MVGKRDESFILAAANSAAALKNYSSQDTLHWLLLAVVFVPANQKAWEKTGKGVGGFSSAHFFYAMPLHSTKMSCVAF